MLSRDAARPRRWSSNLVHDLISRTIGSPETEITWTFCRSEDRSEDHHSGLLRGWRQDDAHFIRHGIARVQQDDRHDSGEFPHFQRQRLRVSHSMWREIWNAKSSVSAAREERPYPRVVVAVAVVVLVEPPLSFTVHTPDHACDCATFVSVPVLVGNSFQLSELS